MTTRLVLPEDSLNNRVMAASVLRLVMLMLRITATPSTMPKVVSSVRRGRAINERIASRMFCIMLVSLRQEPDFAIY